MNTTESVNNDRLLFWVACTLLFTGFGLADTATVAACASLVTYWQLAAFAFSFALIGTGLLFTIWQMRRS
jgi:uncharacterized membrane protein YqjE